MKQAEKNPQNSPAASPPNLERRIFLRNALIAGAALATGCKSGAQAAETSHTLVHNRSTRSGAISLTLDWCKDFEGQQSAQITIFQSATGKEISSVSMLVPGSFRVSAGGSTYEVFADSVSANTAPQSAQIKMVREAEEKEESPMGFPWANEISLFGAAAAFAASLLFAFFSRSGEGAQEEFILPPTRRRQPPHL